MSIPAGTRLGRFEVLSRLGAGGMGQVYLARDTDLGRRVALKVLAPEVASDPERLSRFRLEAVAASALNHPNILTIYDVGEADGVRFIATEYVDGRTLREYLAASRDLGRVVDVFTQICSALGAAHEAGIVHRDLKPENVMVRRDGYVKVLDFGLAKLLEPSSAAAVEADGFVRTMPGMVVGTLGYMSPEQAQGDTVDPRTDVWSIGVMLYEALSGTVPFRGESPVVVFAEILRKEPEPLGRIAPEVPDELERIVAKALRKKRAERHASVDELQGELRAVKQRLDLTVALSAGRETSEMDAVTVVTSAARVGPASGSGGAWSRTNLTAPLVPLIGRERELAEVQELLRREWVRLVTLTGPGGTGKTRLAQQVGRELLAEFEDGVYFVDLSSVADASLVASTIAETLRVMETGDGPLAGSLAAHLAEKRMLLIADNFEQVTDAADLLAELLRAAPGLKVLVTSRARLHLRAEHELEIPPLEVPPDGPVPPLEELRRVAAVRLFVDRAASVRPGFELTESNAEAVAEICRRLEGLPLALELAAARAKLLAPEAMRARLDSRLRLLTDGPRDLPARHRTMRATVAWSYELLDRAERALFRRISVFAGGCALEAAAAVAAPPAETGGQPAAPPGPDVLDLLGSLVDKSLVRQAEDSGGEPRFCMFEVVREYGLELLDVRGEREAVSRAHAHYFHALVEEAHPWLTSHDPSPWLARLAREHDNIRAALEWSFARGGDLGPRMAVHLARFWSARGHLTEGRRWLEEALARTAGERTPLRARLLMSCGYIAQAQRDRRASLPLFEESVAVARELGDATLMANASVGVGIACTDFGDFARARSCYEEVLATARRIGNARIAFHALNNLGEVARGERDFAAARAYYEEALAHEGTDANEWAGYAQVNLGAIAYYEGRYGDMPHHLEKSLEAFVRAGDDVSVATALSGFGAHATATGAHERAARLAGAVEAICRARGTRLDVADEVLFDEWRNAAREALGGDVFERLAAEGRGMGVAEAVALALESSPRNRAHTAGEHERNRAR